MRLIFGASLALDEEAYIACHVDLMLHGLLTPKGRAELGGGKGLRRRPRPDIGQIPL